MPDETPERPPEEQARLDRQLVLIREIEAKAASARADEVARQAAIADWMKYGGLPPALWRLAVLDE